MTDAFSSMEYAHWLIVAGSILLVLGFIGLTFRQRGAEPKLGEAADGVEEGLSKPEDEPALTEAANRKAKLIEQAKRDGLKKGAVPRSDRLSKPAA
jgi:hypothetical protein